MAPAPLTPSPEPSASEDNSSTAAETIGNSSPGGGDETTEQNDAADPQDLEGFLFGSENSLTKVQILEQFSEFVTSEERLSEGFELH